MKVSRIYRARLGWLTFLILCGILSLYFLFVRRIQPSKKFPFEIESLHHAYRSNQKRNNIDNRNNNHNSNGNNYNNMNVFNSKNDNINNDKENNNNNNNYNITRLNYNHKDRVGRFGEFLISNKNNNSKSDRRTRSDQIVTVSMEDYQNGAETGNTLIDGYGQNDEMHAGENGQGVVLTVSKTRALQRVMDEYRVNTLVSDIIPLNRCVPDSRIKGCEKLAYNARLPTASIIVPFYNEWASLLLRTVYSIINRSPRKMVKEIILVDDASTLGELQSLESYISTHFPLGLVRLIRLPERKGLINARMRGVNAARGDVLIFFDSHMEVNIKWLEPLLTEIARDRHRVPMATLDYIQPDTFEYRYNVDYLTRYGWDWSMIFFETFFRNDQIGPDVTSPRPGAAMVGAAFAIERNFFHELGGYDTGMLIWGGENLEMAWRVSLCGGVLIHVPCSRIGHVARAQPYSFPQGRGAVEHFNYKRALEVWAGNYSRFVYNVHPDMKDLDPGDLTERYALRDRLKCKDFKWYLDNLWPELNIYDEDAILWGQVRNEAMKTCLDNAGYVFQAKDALHLYPCNSPVSRQGFTLAKNGRLRTSLQCVVTGEPIDNGGVLRKVALQDCITGDQDEWTFNKGHLVHQQSQQCLDIDVEGPMLTACANNKITQQWSFLPYDLT